MNFSIKYLFFCFELISFFCAPKSNMYACIFYHSPKLPSFAVRDSLSKRRSRVLGDKTFTTVESATLSICFTTLVGFTFRIVVKEKKKDFHRVRATKLNRRIFVVSVVEIFVRRKYLCVNKNWCADPLFLSLSLFNKPIIRLKNALKTRARCFFFTIFLERFFHDSNAKGPRTQHHAINSCKRYKRTNINALFNSDVAK